MKIEQRLRDIRIEQGLSQETLAEKLDVSRQTISKWENGAARPSGENLAALSEVFGLPVDAFLKDDWVPPEEMEPVIQVVEVPVEVPVPNPVQYRLWAILFALLVTVGIAVGVLYFQNRPVETAPVASIDEVKVEVIDPSTILDPVPFLPLED